MISQVELSKRCLFPCPIYTQLRLSVLLIKTTSAFPSLVPHTPLPPSASAPGSRASWPSAPAGSSYGQVSGVSGASLILFLLSFGFSGSLEPKTGGRSETVLMTSQTVRESQPVTFAGCGGKSNKSLPCFQPKCLTLFSQKPCGVGRWNHPSLQLRDRMQAE